MDFTLNNDIVIIQYILIFELNAKLKCFENQHASRYGKNFNCSLNQDFFHKEFTIEEYSGVDKNNNFMFSFDTRLFQQLFDEYT